MRKQLAIIQLKEKTTLLARAREEIGILHLKVEHLAALEEHSRQQQQVLDQQTALIAKQSRTIEKHRELAQQLLSEGFLEVVQLGILAR